MHKLAKFYLFIFFSSLTFNFKTPSAPEVIQILLIEPHKYEERSSLIKCKFLEVIAWRISLLMIMELGSFSNRNKKAFYVSIGGTSVRAKIVDSKLCLQGEREKGKCGHCGE